MEKVKYVRIYADESGESHFEDMEIELTFVDFAPPAAPLARGSFLPAAQMQWLAAPTGWPSDVPHPPPNRPVFVVTQGELELTTSGGEARRFPTGAEVLLEDTSGKRHRSEVASDVDVLALVISVAESETVS